jgi:phospholipid/cholesterol/gamma-HCH transport system substrate-binding protein
MGMSSKKHDFTKTEVLAGALVIASMTVFVAFVIVIQGIRPPQETRVYYAAFTNTIGLDAGADVRFGGVKVGRVAEIIPHPDDRALVRVAMNVAPATPVNAESVATIEQISLTSAKHLDISTGAADAPLLENNGMMQAITKSGGLVDIPDLSGVLGSGEGLLGDVREMLGLQAAKESAEETNGEIPHLMAIAQDIRDLIGVTESQDGEQENNATIADLTEDLRALLGIDEATTTTDAEGTEFPSVTALTGNLNRLLTDNEPALGEILDKVTSLEDEAGLLLEQLNSTLKDNRGSLEDTVNGVASLIDTVNKEMESLLQSLRNTLKNSEALTGEAADLLETNRDDIDELIRGLDEVMFNLSEFTQTLKHHPDAILRGKKKEGRR